MRTAANCLDQPHVIFDESRGIRNARRHNLRSDTNLLVAFTINNSGNFAIMTAITMPLLLCMFGLLYESGKLLTYHSQSERVIAQACERSIKPTRTMTPSDDQRKKNVIDTFDAIVRSTEQLVLSRNVYIDWLKTQVDAHFSYRTVFASIFGIDVINYRLIYSCEGIPPYPYDGEAILSSALTKPDGANISLSYGGCWGVFRYDQIGWDGGAGPGPEVQDWSKASCRSQYGWTGLPPSEFPSAYAIELDSWSNSSIYKYIELHPGKYEISVWYNGRNDSLYGSNEINIYLQPLKPTAGYDKNIITMSQKRGEIAWKKYVYEISVSKYSIYKISIAAGGKSDGFGGVITGFQVKYIDINKENLS